MEPSETQRIFDFLGGQSAPVSSDGIGRQLLHRCPLCQRVWLQDGKSLLLDLRPEQIQHFAQKLSADLDHLPSAICRVCLWQKRGGAVEIDEYGQGAGFGFSWEIPHPLVIHALSAILSQTELLRDAKPDVVTQREKLLAVLRDLKDAHPPRTIQFLDQAFCRQHATENRPGFGQTGTEHWQWQGCFFMLPCPVLHGDAVVTLMLALPSTETFLPSRAFRIWQFLLELTLQGSMLGEKA